MRIFMTALALIGVLGGTGAVAQDNKVVVELYTSQGCSSCPPADALLAQMVDRNDVIALALHVDYWDYLGWKDSFGSAAFTARQHGYAQAAHAETVYTPQMVIGGAHQVIGSKAMDVMDMVAAQRAIAPRVGLEIARTGSRLTINAQAKSAGPGEMVVQVVRYHPEESVAIKHGENRGKTISYVNIVTSWRVIGRWDGVAPLRLETQVDGNDPVVVIVQNNHFGPILAAAEIR